MCRLVFQNQTLEYKAQKKNEPEVVLEDKVYSNMYYNHKLGNVVMDEAPRKIKTHELQIVGWTFIEDQQLMKLNMVTNEKLQMVKINAQLEIGKVMEVEQLLKEFKNVFAWTYKDLKGIPLKLARHIIELDTTIPPAHQAKYRLNPNYVIAVKQDIYKLLAIGFIHYVEEATWLSPLVIVPKKNGKLKICINLKKQRRIHTHYLL